MKIRQLNVDELDRVLDLIEIFDRAPATRPSKDAIAKIHGEIVRLGGAVLGAEVEATIVGTLTVTICPNLSWTGRPYAMIENVLVEEGHRRKGVGSALLSKAQLVAQTAGCYKVALMTGSQRESTFEFYEAAGFTGNKKGFQRRFDA